LWFPSRPGRKFQPAVPSGVPPSPSAPSNCFPAETVGVLPHTPSVGRALQYMVFPVPLLFVSYKQASPGVFASGFFLCRFGPPDTTFSFSWGQPPYPIKKRLPVFGPANLSFFADLVGDIPGGSSRVVPTRGAPSGLTLRRSRLGFFWLLSPKRWLFIPAPRPVNVGRSPLVDLTPFCPMFHFCRSPPSLLPTFF